MVDNHIIAKGMNLEVNESVLPNDIARFIKGWEMGLTEGKSGSESSTSFILTKPESNEVFGSITLPPGTNKSIRGGYIPETSMYYSFVWNSQNNHSIWQLNCKDRTIAKVIQNPCLDFKYDAKHFISQTRFTYFVTESFDKVGNKKTRTWIVFTDDNSRTKQIQVEDCIATNGLTHPFFGNGTCCDICTMITLGAPSKPTGCIEISPVQRPDTEEEKQKRNGLNLKTWQWRAKHIDVWGRESIHGVISDQYYNTEATACTKEETFPRCVDLTMASGCKYIAKIVVEYKNCGVGTALEVNTDWKEYHTIEKYAEFDSNGVYIPDFWNRSIDPKYFQPLSDDNPVIFNNLTSKFTIRFCANKECKSIPKAQTDITQNYIANKSNSVFKLGNKIGVANSERGFSPLPPEQLKKIQLSASENTTCNPIQYAKITIWGYIYSPLDNMVTNIRYFQKANGAPKNSIGYGRIGSTWGDFTTTKDNPANYEQEFNGVSGFVMFPKGHEDLFAVSKQYDISSGTPVLVGVMDKKSGNDQKIIQKWEFYLPKGKYIFEVGSPMAGTTATKLNPNIKFYQTSADVIGICNLNNPGSIIQEKYQIEVDTCNGNVDMMQTPLVIWDLTRDIDTALGAGNLPNAIRCQLFDSASLEAIEDALVTAINTNTPSYSCARTNSRGHFFMTTMGSALLPGTQIEALLNIISCVPSSVAVTPVSDNTSEYVNTVAIANTEYYTIKGVAKDCVTNKPLEGMVVVYERGKYAITDKNGEYSIKAFGLPAFRGSDKIIIANKIGGCIRTICGDPCNACFPKLSVTVPLCGGNRVYELNFQAQTSIFIGGRSLAEGKYGIGAIFEDCIGMETFVQKVGDIEVLDTNKQTIIGFSIGSTFQVDPKFVKMSFYVTENLTYEDWVEWVADYVVLEDNNGNISAPTSATQITPTRIRIYINSLVEYTAYSQSNTSWQFLKGDLVKIFELGNGDSENIIKLASYRLGQDYITIEYDEATMKSFSENGTGAKIRVLRPRSCSTTEGYFQICNYIDINNGVPQVLSGSINYYNSYKVSRAIPLYDNVTIIKDTTVNTYDTAGNVISTKIANIPVSTPTPNGSKRQVLLNHHSPSDFWGNKCWGRGRFAVVNPFERVHRYITEISLSNGVSSEGNTNYLHQFELSNVAQFDEQSYHGITGVVTGQNIILAICKNDYFTLLYDQNEFKMDGKTGQIYAISAVNRFGKPRSKIGMDFGCAQEDINTIFFHNGIVWYLDSNRSALVRHNFEQGTDFTPQGARGWLEEKIFENSKFNKLHTSGFHRVFHGVVCPKNEVYMLCSHQLRSDSEFYVNNLRDISAAANETIMVDINDETQKFTGMHHCTPEMFDAVYSRDTGLQLLSFQNGIPWLHYPLKDAATSFLNFYGLQCKPILTIVPNGKSIEKSFLWIEAKIKEHQLYADIVKTEHQISRIPPKYWSRQNNFWSAPFLCQINGVVDPNIPNNSGQNAILDGQGLKGKWAIVRLIPKDEDDHKYAELGNIIVNSIEHNS